MRKPVVDIAADGRYPPLPDAIDHLARLGTEHCQIAQANDLVHSGTSELSEDGIEGDQVAVDIGDQPDTHVDGR